MVREKNGGQNDGDTSGKDQTGNDPFEETVQEGGTKNKKTR